MADIDDRWHRKGPDGKGERTERYGQGSRWLVRWRDPSGAQRKKAFKRKTDAEGFAASVEHDMRSGSYIDPAAGRVLVGDWAQSWLAAQGHLTPRRTSGTGARSTTTSSRAGARPPCSLSATRRSRRG